MTDDLSYLHPQLKPLAMLVSDLTPDPKNARKRDRRAMEALKDSIKLSGFRSVLIVQKNSEGELVIRVGNGRHQAMTELGHTHIPALVFEESDDEAVKHAIADNRTAELAEWDFEALGEQLGELDKDTEFNVEQLGFSEGEMGLLTADTDWVEDALEAHTPEAAPDRTRQPTPATITVRVLDKESAPVIKQRIADLIAEQFEGKASL